MLIAVILFAAGFTLGWTRAGRRGGSLADRVQFGLAHAIPAGLVGLIISVVAVKLGF